MRTSNKLYTLIFIIACSMILFPGSNALSITSTVSPDHISVNSLYRGSKIVVTGEIEAGREAIIKISSPVIRTHLRKKGKAGGILWMNIGELEFNPVSEIYLLYTTQELNSILNESEQDKYGIGYDAFRRSVEVSPVTDGAERARWIKEFIKFKESNRIYGLFQGKIETRTKGNKKTYSLTVDWPYQAPPREYTVSAYTVKNGLISGESSSTLVVEKVGVLRFLSNMAFNNAAVYGIVSIFIAVFAGFIVSMVFKGGGGGH